MELYKKYMYKNGTEGVKKVSLVTAPSGDIIFTSAFNDNVIIITNPVIRFSEETLNITGYYIDEQRCYSQINLELFRVATASIIAKVQQMEKKGIEMSDDNI